MADDDLPISDQDQARQAAQVAAQRVRRAVTHDEQPSSATALDPDQEPPQVDEEPPGDQENPYAQFRDQEPPADDETPYAQFRGDPQDDGLGLAERLRLNRQEAFYRGTLAGSARLALLSNLFTTPDEPDIGPDRKRINNALRDEYRGIVADLAAYDNMTPFGSTLEAATAAAGQLSGSLLSPKSFIGWGAKGATWLARTGRAALQQGAIQGAVNPAVQGLSMAGGVQQEFEPLGPVMAAGTGAAIGGAMHAGGELLGNVIGQALLRRQLAEMSREDPAFLGIVPHEATAETAAETARPEAPPVPERPAGETQEGEGSPQAPTEQPDELAGTVWAGYRTADNLRQQIAEWRDIAEKDPNSEVAPHLRAMADDAETFLRGRGPGLDHEAHANWRAGRTGEQAPAAPGEQPSAESGPPPGFVRFFHGGNNPTAGGPRWVTTDPEYARNFRSNGEPNAVSYVDIPKGDPTEVAARAWDEIDERAGTNMVGRYNHIEIPEEWAKQLKPYGTPAAETPARPAAIPPEVPDEIFSGSGRAERGAAYNPAGGGAVPIAGPGRYFSFDREHAGTFGPNVERASIGEATQNPLVITDGAQWRALTREAGWDVPNPSGKSEADLQQLTGKLQEIVKAKGHDGIVVWWDDAERGDIGKNGENIKLLRNVFDKPQVISYREPAAAGAALDHGPRAPAPTAPAEPAPQPQPGALVADVHGVRVTFPDRDHADLYEFGRRIREGEKIEPAEAERLFRRFDGHAVTDPERGVEFRNWRDLGALARDYFDDVTERAGRGQPFAAHDVIDPDAREGWYRRALTEQNGGAPATDVAPHTPRPPRPPELIGTAMPGMAPHRVSTPDGRSVDVAPVVVEASDLVTSADAGYDASLQPRQRERAASQAQIREIATRLDPERLGASAEADRGAPIVGPDAMVESGNGRMLAVRRAYEQGQEAAQRYRQWLAGQGVDISKFREPVLVRQRVTPLNPEERRAFTVAANQSATLTLSASERAMADARHIDADTLGLVRNADDLGAVANRDFVRAFVAKLPQAEQGAMTTAEGGLSAEGLTRIRNAVLARAYGDADVLARIAEATNDEVKSISNALVAAAPDWAKLRADVEAGRVRADVDLTPALVEAVSRTADLRARGVKLEAYLAQQDAFDRLTTPVETFMRIFYDPAGRRAANAPRIADALRFYAEEARKVTAEAGLDLGLPEVTALDIQRTALRRNANAGQQEQGGLFLRSSTRDVTRGEAGGRQVPGREPREGGLGAGAASPGGPSGRPAGSSPAELTSRTTWRRVLDVPEVRAAIEHPQIERNGDVPYGAGADNRPGITHVDHHIPPSIDVKLADGSGTRAIDPAEPLNVHEQVEHYVMEKLIGQGVPRERAYLIAHHHFAVPAERDWIESRGLSWAHYTEEIAGHLDHIEHEHPANPPAGLYTRPYPHDEALLLEHAEHGGAAPIGTPDEPRLGAAARRRPAAHGAAPGGPGRAVNHGDRPAGDHAGAQRGAGDRDPQLAATSRRACQGAWLPAAPGPHTDAQCARRVQHTHRRGARQGSPGFRGGVPRSGPRHRGQGRAGVDRPHRTLPHRAGAARAGPECL